MFPLRKDYMGGLLADSGFQKVESYGDFQSVTEEPDPDFYVHIAHKGYHAG
jgi:hypothetical protein